MFTNVMNRFISALSVFLFAFVPSHTYTYFEGSQCLPPNRLVPLRTIDGPAEYEIPEACREEQFFPLYGMHFHVGTTFIYKNTRNLRVSFYVCFEKYHSPEATVSVHTDTETKVFSISSVEIVDKKPMNLSVTGIWYGVDYGYVSYWSEDGNYEDCYHRTASRFNVLGIYSIPRMKEKELTIQALEDCGLVVWSNGLDKECNATLDFGDGREYNAAWVGPDITTGNSSISFRIRSDCKSGYVNLQYIEKCPPITRYVPSHSNAGSGEYEIPEACRDTQSFALTGNGATFIYKNTRNLRVSFDIFFYQYHSWKPTVTVHTDTETKVFSESFNVTVDKKPMNFTLTGSWLDHLYGSVSYWSEDGNYEDCYHRTASRFYEWGYYDLPPMKDKELTIQALEDCGLEVWPDGVSGNKPFGCNATLDFGDGREYNAAWVGPQITTENSSVSFRIHSDCESSRVALYYIEKCPPITPETSQSTDSSPPMTETSQSTDSSPPMTKTSQSTDSSPPMTETSQSTDSSPPMSSGVIVVLFSLLVTTIRTWRMLQW